MSTIGSLLLALGQGGPAPYGDIAAQTAATRGRELGNETALLKLAELKRSQASEETMMAAIQQDPDLARLFFGDTTLGGIGQPSRGGPMAPSGPPAGPAGPPGGPLTQQTTLPGQPPGAPQMVPGGQDLSRFANVPPTGGGPIPPNVMGQVTPQVTPPPGTPTLATIVPQGGMPGAPQGAMQGPRNPVLEMAAKDPRAALLLQQQMQTQQDRQWKMQEQGLSNRIKVVDYLSRMAQGATDQDSWKQFLEEADRVQPGAGARLPQTYSKEARDRVVAQGIDAKDTMTLQVNEMKARAEQIRAGLAGRTDAVNTELEIMGLTPATASPPQLKEAADKAEARQVRIQQGGVTPQIVEGEGGIKYAVNPHTLERRPIPGGAPGTATGSPAATPTAEPMRGPLTADDKKLADYAARMERGQQLLSPLEDSGDYTSWKAPIANLPGGRMVLSEKQQSYENAKGIFLQGILRRDSQGQISAQEWADYSRIYFPQPGEGPEIVKQKQQRRAEAIQEQKALLGRPAVTSPVPTSQGSTGTGGQAPTTAGAFKPLKDMSREERLAERDALRKKAGQ